MSCVPRSNDTRWSCFDVRTSGPLVLAAWLMQVLNLHAHNTLLFFFAIFAYILRSCCPAALQFSLVLLQRCRTSRSQHRYLPECISVSAIHSVYNISLYILYHVVSTLLWDVYSYNGSCILLLLSYEWLKNWAASKSCSIPPRSLRSAHTICVCLYVVVVSIHVFYNVKSIYFLIIRSSMYIRIRSGSEQNDELSFCYIVCLSEKEENNYLILFSCQRRSIEVDLLMSRKISDLLSYCVQDCMKRELIVGSYYE